MNKRSLTPEELELLNEQVISVELTLMQWISVRASIKASIAALADQGDYEISAEFEKINSIIDVTEQLEGEKYRQRMGASKP